MEPASVTLPVAFLAGLVSFASPCVLPLVPAYLGYLGGTAVTVGGEHPEAERSRVERSGSTFAHAVLFVLGFAAVFVALGATATLLGSLLRDYGILFRRVGGVLLVIFGLRLMGVQKKREWWIAVAVIAGLLALIVSQNEPLLRPPQAPEGAPLGASRVADGLAVVAVVLAAAGFPLPVQAVLALAAGGLNYLASPDQPVPNLIGSLLIAVLVFFLGQADIFYTERRLELGPGRPMSYLRSLLVGVIFAAGWTPCIGPILGGIMMLAASLDTMGQGIGLLAAYSLGLGIPFLLVGLAFDRLAIPLRRAGRYLGIISAVSGALLAIIGVLMFTDALMRLAQYGNWINLEL